MPLGVCKLVNSIVRKEYRYNVNIYRTGLTLDMKINNTASHVANFFIKRAKKDKYDLTHLKLQKLVYIAYGWVLATLDKKLFSDNIEAWKHGPVVASLYHEFKLFRDNPITSFSTCYDLDTGDISTPFLGNETMEDKETLVVLDKVWGVYKDFTGWSLRNKTHEPNTPWFNTYDNGLGENNIIEDKVIKPHFEEKLRLYLRLSLETS